MEDNIYFPPPAFYFSVVTDEGDAAFQEVSGISKEMGFEEVTAGGENRFKYRLPTVTTNTNLVLKRGLAPSGSGLVAWCDDTIGLATLPVKTRNITVNLLNEANNPVFSWCFYKAYPVRYSVSDFHSQENKLVIELMEFAYTYFETVNLQAT